MGKNNRSEVAKRLTEEIAKTTDPEMIVRLSTQLAKIQPKRRRSRKPVDAPKQTKKNNYSPILDEQTGSMVDNLTDGKKVLNHLVVQIEKRQREIGRELTKAERDALVTELSERERAAYGSFELGDGCLECAGKP